MKLNSEIAKWTPAEVALVHGMVTMALPTPLEVRARELALGLHERQKYGALPYAVHLEEAYRFACAFQSLPVVRAAVWLHDALEDTEVDAATLDAMVGRAVTTLVWAVTLDRTVPRAGQFRDSVLRIVDVGPHAVMVKLADRCANTAAVLRSLLYRPSTAPADLRVAAWRQKYIGQAEMFERVLYTGDAALEPAWAIWRVLTRALTDSSMAAAVVHGRTVAMDAPVVPALDAEPGVSPDSAEDPGV